MMQRAWKLSGLLAVALVAGNAGAGGTSNPTSPPAGPTIVITTPLGCLPGAAAAPPWSGQPGYGNLLPAPSVPLQNTPAQAMPGTTNAAPAPAPAPTPTDTTTGMAGQGATAEGGTLSLDTGSGFAESNPAPVGVGLASATTVTAGGGGPGTFSVIQNQAQTPLILPGLFTAITAESARPIDRVFMGYGYFDGFRVSDGQGGLRPGFNLNRFDVGVEKTFFDGRGSVYVRVPFLYAANNTSGAPLDGLGDISAGIKMALLADPQSGSVLTGGMTVSAPTARDLRIPTTASTTNTQQIPNFVPGVLNTFNIAPGIGINPPPSVTKTINPTFLQPWVGGLLVLDRFFVQEYFGVVVPTDTSVSTFINNDFGVGFRLYRSDCQDSLLTSVTPTVNVQALLPLNHQGSPAPAAPINNSSATASQIFANPTPSTLNSPYQVFLTGGVQFGLTSRALLSIGVVQPIVGPKAFNTGGVVGFNFFY